MIQNLRFAGPSDWTRWIRIKIKNRNEKWLEISISILIDSKSSFQIKNSKGKKTKQRSVEGRNLNRTRVQSEQIHKTCQKDLKRKEIPRIFPTRDSFDGFQFLTFVSFPLIHANHQDYHLLSNFINPRVFVDLYRNEQCLQDVQHAFDRAPTQATTMEATMKQLWLAEFPKPRNQKLWSRRRFRRRQ